MKHYAKSRKDRAGRAQMLKLDFVVGSHFKRELGSQ